MTPHETAAGVLAGSGTRPSGPGRDTQTATAHDAGQRLPHKGGRQNADRALQLLRVLNQGTLDAEFRARVLDELQPLARRLEVGHAVRAARQSISAVEHLLDLAAPRRTGTREPPTDHLEQARARLADSLPSLEALTRLIGEGLIECVGDETRREWLQLVIPAAVLARQALTVLDRMLQRRLAAAPPPAP